MEERKIEQITEILANMNEGDIVEAWNIMCSDCGRESESIRDMGEIDDFFSGYSVREVHNDFDLSRFDFDDYWWKENDCGDLESSCDAWDFIDVDDLAEHSVNWDEDFGDGDIRDILDGENEEEEEEEETPDLEQTPEAQEEQVEEQKVTLRLTHAEMESTLKGLRIAFQRAKIAHKADPERQDLEELTHELGDICSSFIWAMAQAKKGEC